MHSFHQHIVKFLQGCLDSEIRYTIEEGDCSILVGKRTGSGYWRSDMSFSPKEKNGGL